MRDQRFGRLVVLGDSGRRSSSRHVIWRCVCDCGSLIEARTNDLRGGNTKSCGCLLAEVRVTNGQITGEKNTAHGHRGRGARSRTPTYHSWNSMKARCTNRNNKKWKDYGGRGIKVCDRWLVFENFLADMGERPRGKTLDRYPDVNGDYEPGNCRWATLQEQRANRRDTQESARA